MRNKFVLADIRLPKRMEQTLTQLGFEVILLPPSSKLPTPLASHTDMLCFISEDEIITERDYYEENRELIESVASLGQRRVVISDKSFKNRYPDDALFNALLCDDIIFLKTDSVAEEILAYAERTRKHGVSVKQGYPACTVLYLGKNHAITADGGMSKALADNGISTTLIDNSEKIQLPPHQYGFIGGAAGVYNETVYFIGNLDAHPNARDIRAALDELSLECVSLDPDCDSLIDLGGLRFFDGGTDSNS